MTESLGGGSSNNGGDRPSFVALLFQKLAFTKQVESQTGKSTGAAQTEVLRQIRQVSKSQGGDGITGKGVTKSGGDDGST